MKIIPMLTGAIIFPLYVLGNGLWQVVVAVLTCIVLFFVTAKEIFSKLSQIEIPIILVPLITISAMPLLLLGLTAALAVFILALAIFTPFDLIRSLWTGLKVGFQTNLEGVWNALKAYPIFYERLFGYPKRITTQEFNALEEPSPTTQIRLTADQIKQIEDTLTYFTAQTTTLPPITKQQVNDLKLFFERYTELVAKLNAVQTAFDAHLDEIEDELIGIEIVNPILLYKQYQQQDGTWLTVPASSRITGYEGMRDWLIHNSKHPRHQDPLNEPNAHLDPTQPFLKRPTRYRWHRLTATCCWAQELIDSANKILQLHHLLPPQLQSTQNPAHSPVDFHPPLFLPKALEAVHQEQKLLTYIP